MIAPAKIQVRFSDLDIMGHVTNSVYLSYFEYARIYYFGRLLGKDWNWRKNGVLLAKNEVEYLAPIRLTDEPLVAIQTERIGTKSFMLSYKITVAEKLVTTGSSTLVCYNSLEQKSIEIPKDLKMALQQLKKE